MKKTILWSAFILSAFIINAQTPKPQDVIASVGYEGTAGAMTVTYTIGESFVTTFDNGSNILSQGFHQPYYIMVAVNEPFDIGEVKVFPNPTNSILQIQFDKINTENIEVKLFDLTGKPILLSKIESTNTWQTNLSDLPSANYILSVTDIVNHKSNSYKIFKSN
jgi:hypothetical protein